MTKRFDNRIGKVSSRLDFEKDERFARNLNRFVLLLAVIVTLALTFAL